MSDLKRATQKASTTDYFEAKKAAKERGANHEYLWFEAVHPNVNEKITYTIHVAEEKESVPSFAIEVYQRGKLLSYEPSMERIRDLGKMPEQERQMLLRSSQAQAFVSEQGAGAHASPAMR